MGQNALFGTLQQTELGKQLMNNDIKEQWKHCGDLDLLLIIKLFTYPKICLNLYLDKDGSLKL